jgi:hypothetical protein
VAEALEESSHPGAILGVARFYHDPRGSMRAMLESGPREARLLAYAMIAVVLLLAERILSLMAAAGPGTDLTARVTEQAVSLLFFLPLAYCMLAALGTMIARAFGGTGSWFQGRAAFFWAALVSAPIMLVSGVAAIAAAGIGGWAPDILRQLGAIFFAWALAHCYAEAFGFRSALKVLVVIALIALVPLGLLWAAGGN